MMKSYIEDVKIHNKSDQVKSILDDLFSGILREGKERHGIPFTIIHNGVSLTHDDGDDDICFSIEAYTFEGVIKDDKMMRHALSLTNYRSPTFFFVETEDQYQAFFDLYNHETMEKDEMKTLQQQVGTILCTVRDMARERIILPKEERKLLEARLGAIAEYLSDQPYKSEALTAIQDACDAFLVSDYDTCEEALIELLGLLK